MNTVVFRPYNLTAMGTHASRCGKLLRSALYLFAGNIWPGHRRERRLSRQRVCHPKRRVHIGLVETRREASRTPMIFAVNSCSRWSIRRIAVAGIGRTLLNRAMDRLTERGASVIQLASGGVSYFWAGVPTRLPGHRDLPDVRMARRRSELRPGSPPGPTTPPTISRTDGAARHPYRERRPNRKTGPRSSPSRSSTSRRGAFTWRSR